MTTRLNEYKVECPFCGDSKETTDMQEAHDWGRQHRYHNHKGMTAMDMPVVSIRPNEKECLEMWETSTSPKEYEDMYDKFMVDHATRHINTQKLICMRCGAWDAVNNRPDDAKCGINCAILTKGKTQGFNCKLQRYQKNLLRSEL